MRYDYKCNFCGHEQEEERPMADHEKPGTCEKCGGVSERHIKFNGVFKGLSTPGSHVSRRE